MRMSNILKSWLIVDSIRYTTCSASRPNKDKFNLWCESDTHTHNFYDEFKDVGGGGMVQKGLIYESSMQVSCGCVSLFTAASHLEAQKLHHTHTVTNWNINKRNMVDYGH